MFSLDIKKLAEEEKGTIVAFRRHFHEHPELSQKELKTMDYIEEHLHEWGIKTVRVPHGGIFGFIDGAKPGAAVLMRADIDALPIQESRTNLSHERTCISQNDGVMHACGHDGHMAMLLTEAKILSAHKNEWDGHVILMFEEAEEMGECGVAHLLRYLRDNRIHVDYCFGTHVYFNLPSGKIGVLYGTMMAGAYFFKVRIHGKGGHGSRPDMAQSPIEAFISLASELRSYRMRKVDPSHSLTYSFGSVLSGDGEPNIIPSELEFAGTARFTINDDGLVFMKDMHHLLDDVCKAYGTTYEMLTEQYFPVTSNNTKELVDLAVKAIDKNMGAGTVDPKCPVFMASETFSITESTYPGIFMFTGIKNDKVGSGAPHHTPQFDLDEDGLVTGVGAALSYVLAVLKEKPKTPSFHKVDLESMLKLTEPPKK